MQENTFVRDKKDKMLLIIIGCLSVVLILLFIFFLVERSQNKEHIAVIHQEKEMLEQELTDLSHNYDDLKTSNDTLNEKLLQEQENHSRRNNRYRGECKQLRIILLSKILKLRGKRCKISRQC